MLNVKFLVDMDRREFESREKQSHIRSCKYVSGVCACRGGPYVLSPFTPADNMQQALVFAAFARSELDLRLGRRAAVNVSFDYSLSDIATYTTAKLLSISFKTFESRRPTRAHQLCLPNPEWSPNII
jgi:hypothetical protein